MMLFDLIREHQLDIMFVLCVSCATMMIMLAFTRFLRRGRKRILILLLFIATILLWFDRMAYIYSGDSTSKGYFMVRLSNFMVFFLTSGVLFGFNLYTMDLVKYDLKLDAIPRRLWIVHILSIAGMLLSVIAALTGLYYTFDENNRYHRGSGFLIAYIVPVIGPLLIYTVIRKYRSRFSRYIYTSLVLYIFVPVIVGIIQIFAYGVSIVNMAMVLISVSLYIFTYLDINDEVERLHKIEIENLRLEHESMKRLFEQIATAFVTAVEKRTPYLSGHSQRVANVARIIAKNLNKSEEECDEVYYSALLHDVGMAALPDDVLEQEGRENPITDENTDQKPVIGAEILANIKEYPYLSQSVRHMSERYDGKGYPDGLSGENIPETSRIIMLADAYDKMTIKQGARNPLPEPVVREEIIMGAGAWFDPSLANLMVHLMDSDLKYVHNEIDDTIENEILCGTYRDAITKGIPIETNISEISFECKPTERDKASFSMPSLILFDSFDRQVHKNAKAIGAYHYNEYGEIWFDGHGICTGARNMEIDVSDGSWDDDLYHITAFRYEDHLKIVTANKNHRTESVFALPDRTKSAYLAITGENCHITDIKVSVSDREAKEGDIKRIADEISFIDRLEADINNVQVDRYRSSTTAGVPVTENLRLVFHAMTLPSANLVWHCPYIVLFSSEDKRVGGKDYHEYALIKLNGEYEAVEVEADNDFSMKKDNDFPGWNTWKEVFRAGKECEINLSRKGKRIRLYTENLGLHIENTTILNDDPREVYVALTGDEVALTDIRVYQ